jgi:hypothetical protein
MKWTKCRRQPPVPNPNLNPELGTGVIRRRQPTLQHRHHEEAFDDFERQPLLPRRLSQLGPGVSWFDVDGDGHEDLIIEWPGRSTGLLSKMTTRRFSRRLSTALRR